MIKAYFAKKHMMSRTNSAYSLKKTPKCKFSDSQVEKKPAHTHRTPVLFDMFKNMKFTKEQKKSSEKQAYHNKQKSSSDSMLLKRQQENNKGKVKKSTPLEL